MSDTSTPITVLCWNLENNGSGDATKRQRAHELLASLSPHLVMRQEMWGSSNAGKTPLYEMEEILGLRGWLGPGSHTALFADPRFFRPVREFDAAPVWAMAPTALALQFEPAGSNSRPFVCASYHLNYASPTNRLAETEWATTWADKQWTTLGGEVVAMSALMGGDNNSFPVPGVVGDPGLPLLDEIEDQPHRVHRSFTDPDGNRQMDTRTDTILCTAGLEDAARHWATRSGDMAAVSRTVNACETHGPDARVDRIYATEDLLGAVASVDVVEVPLNMPDHHIVRVVLNGDRLAEALTGRVVEGAV